MRILDNNLTITTYETWFMYINILKIICTLIAIILAVIFLLIITIDKTCHTIPMMLVANSCLTEFVYACNLFGMNIFTIENDLKQIQFYNSFCIFVGYLSYSINGIQMYSFVLQAIYRYIKIIYPTRLFYQSGKFQICLICLTWICGIIYPIPIVFTDQIKYYSDDQICQMPLQFSFLIIFNASYIYFLPLIGIILIYIKMILYVKEMSKHVIPVNTLHRAQRELTMIGRIVSLIIILLILGVPYTIFILMSFFTSTPKYHFRIAYISVNLSLTLVLIVIFQITDPLKVSIMKRLNRQTARIMPTQT